MDKEKIKKIALQLVAKNGLINLSRKDLCAELDIPDGSFAHHAGTTFGEFLTEISPLIDSNTTHVVKKSRVTPKLRKDHILKAAVERSKVVGYNNLTRADVVCAAGVSLSLINHYFHTMKQLKNDIMRYAVKNGIDQVVRQGVLLGDPRAKK